MKVVVAQMKHETHSFVDTITPLKNFTFAGEAPLSGAEADAACRGQNTALAAFVDVLENKGMDVMVAAMGEAMPSGPVVDQAFEWFCDKILTAVATGCDGLLLDLHGSMVTQSVLDGEGELLKRIRRLAPQIPVGVVFDFHATLTDAIANFADIITLYRTLPHVDMYDTGTRAANLLVNMIQGRIRPVTGVYRIPVMASLERMDPGDFPLNRVWDEIRALEQKDSLLNIDLCCGHPFTDAGPGGICLTITSDNAPDTAAAAANQILNTVWQHRHDLVEVVEPYENMLEKALGLPQGPVIMADSGDIPASGGFAADMSVLKKAMAMGFADMIAGPFHDPGAVQKMIKAGVGQQVTLDIGGRVEAPRLGYRAAPLGVTGRVRAVVDGRITATGPMLKGLTVSIGLMAVLSVADIDILVTEQRIEALDVAVFTHVGLDPVHRKYTLLKSRQHFRAAFEPIARHVVRIPGPGVTNPDFTRFPFCHIHRPIFPLEKQMDFKITVLGDM